VYLDDNFRLRSIRPHLAAIPLALLGNATLAAAPSQDLINPGVLRYIREIGLVK
jgi:hypothetical protein